MWYGQEVGISEGSLCHTESILCTDVSCTARTICGAGVTHRTGLIHSAEDHTDKASSGARPAFCQNAHCAIRDMHCMSSTYCRKQVLTFFRVSYPAARSHTAGNCTLQWLLVYLYSCSNPCTAGFHLLQVFTRVLQYLHTSHLLGCEAVFRADNQRHMKDTSTLGSDIHHQPHRALS